MGTLFLSEIKKQASSFLQKKYKTARLAFTDVTTAELLTEEATNSDPCSPDARTMTRISEAAFEVDDYWRIVDVLHQRLYTVDWKEWRSSYKALMLLDFLLTHGPETVADEFQCDLDVIEELGKFKHIDKRGFNWGSAMQKRSERILELLKEKELLLEARIKALKVSKQIKGFGNLLISPSSSSTRTLRTTSCRSYFSSSPTFDDSHELHRHEQQIPTKDFNENSQKSSLEESTSLSINNENDKGTHLLDSPIQETGSLLDPECKEETDGYSSAIGSKLVGITSPWSPNGGNVGIRSFSNVGKVVRRKIDRQLSLSA